MKIRLISFLFLFNLVCFSSYGQFSRNANGVTIECPFANVGDTGVVDGVTYTAVDRSSLITKIAAGQASECCTSLVTDMNSLFSGNATNPDIRSWDTSSVTSTAIMFMNATNFNQDLSKWNIGKVQSTMGMFQGATNFNNGEAPGASTNSLNSWDTSEVIELRMMFKSATSFNQDIGNWDTSKNRTMDEMFSSAYRFNRPIGNWNVSNVVSMEKMFHVLNGQDSDFNQPLNNWDVSNVINMSYMFGTTGGDGHTDNRAFNQDIGDWDVSNVTNMIGMFKSAEQFNQDLSDWNVASVSDFRLIFDRAYAYNNTGVSLSCWDTSSATRMDYMFYMAAFSQDLSAWCVALIGSLQTGFEIGRASCRERV